jgi:hypothetical protein
MPGWKRQLNEPLSRSRRPPRVRNGEVCRMSFRGIRWMSARALLDRHGLGARQWRRTLRNVRFWTRSLYLERLGTICSRFASRQLRLHTRSLNLEKFGPIYSRRRRGPRSYPLERCRLCTTGHQRTLRRAMLNRRPLNWRWLWTVNWRRTLLPSRLNPSRYVGGTLHGLSPAVEGITDGASQSQRRWA